MSTCRMGAPCIALHLTDAEHIAITESAAFVLVIDKHDLVNLFSGLSMAAGLPSYRHEVERIRAMIRDQLSRQGFFPVGSEPRSGS